jgi:hypothetical protein
MIIWPLVTKYEFQPEWGMKIQLTQGIQIKYMVVASGTEIPKYKFEVWIGENHYVIYTHLPLKVLEQTEVFHILSITRKKNLITLTINGESRKYYLKTPMVWKVKYL